MIQRKQTLYLLIASIFAFTYLFSSPVFSEITGTMKEGGSTETLVISYTETTFSEKDTSIEASTVKNNYLTLTLAVIGGIGLLTLLLFKKRKLQLRLASYLVMFDLLLLFLIYYQNSIGLKLFEEAETTWKVFAFLPAILPILHLLALRGIVHDIKLLQSVDRLR